MDDVYGGLVARALEATKVDTMVGRYAYTPRGLVCGPNTPCGLVCGLGYLVFAGFFSVPYVELGVLCVDSLCALSVCFAFA